MGKLAICPDAMKPKQQEVIDFTGPLRTAVMAKFPLPQAFGGRNAAVAVNGVQLTDEEWWETDIGPDDEASIIVTPGDPVTIRILIQVAIAIGSALIARSLQPSRSANAFIGAPEPSPVYSVGVQANQARIGAVIPVQYGEVKRSPDLASQSYRFFEGNRETRVFLFCVGAGEFDHNNAEIFIGSTSINSLRPDVVMHRFYGPGDHGETIGTIAADFGIHENVYTAGEVDNQTLPATDAFDEDVTTASAQFLANGTTVSFTQTLASLGVEGVGQQIEFDNIQVVEFGTPPGDFTGTIVSIDDANTVTISGGSFPTNEYTADVTVTGSPTIEIAIGPFVCCLEGQTTNRVEVDVEFPGGLWIQETDGTLSARNVGVRFEFQELDSTGNPTGGIEIRGATFTGSTNTPLRFTRAFDLPRSARWQVTAFRTTPGDGSSGSTTQSQSNWTGLKAYLDYGPGSVYGQTTILAMKVSGSNSLADAALQRIQLRMRRLIQARAGSSVGFRQAPSAVASDILANTDYSIGLPRTSIDPSLDDLDAALVGLNGVFDTETTVLDALQSAYAPVFAEVTFVGGEVGAVVDQPGNSTTLITPNVMTEGSWRRTATIASPLEDDGFRIEYRGAADFEPKELTFPANAQRPRRVPMWGVTSDSIAQAIAERLWRTKIRRHTVIEFGCEYEGRLMQKGDIVRVVPPDPRYQHVFEVSRVVGTVVITDPPPRVGIGGPAAIWYRNKNDNLAVGGVNVVANGFDFFGGLPSGLDRPEANLLLHQVVNLEAIPIVVDDVTYQDDRICTIRGWVYDGAVF